MKTQLFSKKNENRSPKIFIQYLGKKTGKYSKTTASIILSKKAFKYEKNNKMNFHQKKNFPSHLIKKFNKIMRGLKRNKE